MERVLPRRKASYLERYCVMSRNAGYPNIMAYFVSFVNNDATHTSDSYVTLSTLEKRIDLLQSHFPMLWAEVVDGRTTKPHFQERAQGKWLVKDVLAERYLMDEENDHLGHIRNEGESSDQKKNMARKVRMETEMIKREIDRMTDDSDPRTRPPWQITLVRRRGRTDRDQETLFKGTEMDADNYESSSSDQDQLAYLLLAVDHTHFDGQAGLNFLSLLLRSPSDPTLLTLPHEHLINIPACEESLDLRPGWKQMISVMTEKVFVPMLPGFLRRRIEGEPKWPGMDVMRSPMDVEWELTGGWIEGDVVRRLKEVGKRRGVKTLHPILKAGFLVALWTVIRERKGSTAATSETETSNTNPPSSSQAGHKPFRIEALTPRSERDPPNNHILKHSLANGNYVTNSLIDCLISPETDFWVFAAGLAEELMSEKGIKLGRGLQGLMGYLPDGQLERMEDIDKTDEEGSYNPTPTKWEAFFLDKAASASPFLVGLQISNLGYVSSELLLPCGATSISFGQGCAPFSSPVSFNVVGSESGIRWTTCFRDGSAVTRREVEMMDEVANVVFERLANGVGGSLGQMTEYSG